MPARDETETVISWTSADEFATVYTMHSWIKRRCEKAGAQETELDKGIRNGRKVAWTFLVPIHCVTVRKPRQGRKLTSEQAKRLFQARRTSSGVEAE